LRYNSDPIDNFNLADRNKTMSDTTPALQGVIAAAATPFTADGAIDTAAYLNHCRWLLAHGCDGINVLGTTGEANSIGLAARHQLLDIVGASGLPMAQLMVGTGGCALSDTVELTRHAVQCGFAGQLVLPPFYYKPVDDDGMFAFFAQLIETIADDRLRLYLYNFPQLTGIPFSLAVIQRLTRAYPDVVVGLKDSSGDMENAKSIVDACPGFAVFPSSEAVLQKGREQGFAGCISATVNLTSVDAGRVWQTPTAPESLTRQALISQIRAHIASYTLIPAIKYLLRHLYDSPVWERLLPPMRPLSAAQGDALSTKVGVHASGAVLL
jgi:4-hydroxy-tetrahydrodipicolinate synthase